MQGTQRISQWQAPCTRVHMYVEYPLLIEPNTTDLKKQLYELLHRQKLFNKQKDVMTCTRRFLHLQQNLL